MTVEIKKAKLTKALFDQIQFLSKEDILSEEFYPVGWCVAISKTKLNLKYIVLNDSSNGELRKMLMYSFVENVDNKYIELHNPHLNVANQKIKLDSNDLHSWDKTSYELSDLLHKIKRVAEEKGQFYL